MVLVRVGAPAPLQQLPHPVHHRHHRHRLHPCLVCAWTTFPPLLGQLLWFVHVPFSYSMVAQAHTHATHMTLAALCFAPLVVHQRDLERRAKAHGSVVFLTEEGQASAVAHFESQQQVRCCCCCCCLLLLPTTPY